MANSPRAPQGTRVLENARFHTLGPAGTAEAIAIRDGRFVAVGSRGGAWSAVGSDAPRVDLGGRIVLPGLIDAHVHWGKVALARRRLQLAPEMALDEVLARVRAAAAAQPRGTWIVGRGWDHSGWGRWPAAADLDAAAPGHPVRLTRKDGHADWLSSAALAAAGISAETPDPPGGQIQRFGGLGVASDVDVPGSGVARGPDFVGSMDVARGSDVPGGTDRPGRADRTPTGILLENALELVARVVPHPGAGERRAALIESWPDAWRHGLVAVHDMGFHAMQLYDDLAALREEGRLGLRVVWYVMDDALDEAVGRGMTSGHGDAWLAVGGLKLFLDGTLGSQTADMIAPFEGQPGNRGIATMDFETFCDLAARAADAGLATAVHCIGDGANRKALDGFALVRRTRSQAVGRLRHRIEHAQIVAREDFGRFAALGVVASMQPIHATVDMPVADRYWGPRTDRAYAWRSVLASGARLAFGSDAPIETHDVMAGLHAAVTRQDAGGLPAGGWHPEQRLTVAEALAAYTLGAAWAGGQEAHLGSIEAGKSADLVVVDRDPFAVPPAELRDVRVLGTMIEGAWVWQAPGAALGGPWHPVASA